MSDMHKILDAADIEGILEKTADEIIQKHKSMDQPALVGIHTRGAFLAERLRHLIEKVTGKRLDTGAVDINLYRDDWTRIGAQPVVRKSDIAFDLDGRQIILIDDVLFTGRTVRAGMDALMDFGRPARLELAVLIDRGHRELPIHADYIGYHIDTTLNEAVNVLLSEIDGEDGVEVMPVKKYGHS